MKKQQTNSKCKMCGRTISDDSKLKLCPDCTNKNLTPAAGVTLLGFGIALKAAWKNKDKIAKGTVKAAKTIISIIKKG